MSDFRISFEFFPPKSDEALEKLLERQKKLAEKEPEFFSVTFGAGGSTKDRTWETVMKVRDTGIDTAPHLSCIGQRPEDVAELVHQYREAGIQRIVALRGDIPSGMGHVKGGMSYADELVKLIREETGDHFTLEVAAYPEMHPQARSFSDDIDHLQRKFDAGADHGITQYFYNPDAWSFYLEELDKRGVTKPVYPGVMPIINYDNVKRFSAKCGAEIPRWIHYRMEELEGDEQGRKEFGEEVVTKLCQQLIERGAKGLHFYTMNQAGPNLRILDNLGL